MAFDIYHTTPSFASAHHPHLLSRTTAREPLLLLHDRSLLPTAPLRSYPLESRTY